ncbi:MAG: cation:dicarboxylate symporter family transporter, partial [Spirochaetota bacterium]
ALGILIGTFAGDWAGTRWLMHLVVFGKTFLKDLIQFFLPLIMITFLAVGIADLGKRAGSMLKFTLSLAYLYTLIACAIGAVVIVIFFQIFPAVIDAAAARSVEPRPLPPNIVNLRIPFPFSESLITSIVLGFVLGIGMTWVKSDNLMKVMKEGRELSAQMIRRVIIPVIPFYVGCVFGAIAYQGDLWPKMRVFGYMLLIIVALQWIWLFIQYSIAGGYAGQNPYPVFKIMFPAYLTAWGTTSSAVTMPVSLARGKTIPHMKEDVADFVFPMCSQVHLSGSAMTITISAITVSLLTYGRIPALAPLILFMVVLSIIEVGAVGVPGGSIMAAWPALTGILLFGDEAMGLMFALFLIQDSFGTAANITGDASIAMIVNRKFGRAAER